MKRFICMLLTLAALLTGGEAFAQRLQNGSYSTVGYIKSDGTVQVLLPHRRPQQERRHRAGRLLQDHRARRFQYPERMGGMVLFLPALNN